MSGFDINDCLTETSLGCKWFGNYNKDRDFFTFTDKYVRDFKNKTTKGGRVADTQFQEELNTFKKTFKKKWWWNFEFVDEYLKYNNI